MLGRKLLVLLIRFLDFSANTKLAIVYAHVKPALRIGTKPRL